MTSTINIIDPVYFNNKSRAEFRLDLDNVAYLSSGCYLALGGFGADALLTEVNYNRRAGVAGLVSSIRLLNGGDVLAQLDNAGSWMAWKGSNHDNADAFSKKMGPCNASALMHVGIANADVQEVIGTADSSTKRGEPGTTEADCSLGYLPITAFLKELETLRVLPTSVFDNLRLVIEFSSDLTAILQQQDRNSGVAVSAFTKVRPILVVESIADPEIIKAMIADMGAISLSAIESDQFVMPAVTTGRQRLLKQIRGFNNKIVNRVLMVTQPTGALDGVLQTKADGTVADVSIALDAGRLNSLVQNKLTVNARVNGANIFQGAGLGFAESEVGAAGTRQELDGAGHNHRLACLTDTWGDVAMCAGGNSCGLVVQGLQTAGTIDKLIASKMGQFFYGQDYTGFRVMSRVSHLEFDMARSHVAGAAMAVMSSTAPNQQINVIVYAEVPKILQVSQGGYRVAYM